MHCGKGQILRPQRGRKLRKKLRGQLTWPIHFQRLRAIVVYILSCWHSSKRSWFEIIWGQKILKIFRRFLVWKNDNFDMSSSVVRQHSDPYNRVERTQLLYNFNFVCVLYCCDFHTGHSILKALCAFEVVQICVTREVWKFSKAWYF